MTSQARLRLIGLCVMLSLLIHSALIYLWAGHSPSLLAPTAATAHLTVDHFSFIELLPSQALQKEEGLPDESTTMGASSLASLLPKPSDSTSSLPPQPINRSVAQSRAHEPIAALPSSPETQEPATVASAASSVSLPVASPSETPAIPPVSEQPPVSLSATNAVTLAANALDMVRQGGSLTGSGSGSGSIDMGAAKPGTPRKMFVSTSTKDYRIKQYLENWRQKVQRVGKQAYPEDRGDHRLKSKALVRVHIGADGSLIQATLVRSSNIPHLDAAAINIVQMAAPYAPFPKNFPKEAGSLEFERYWTFEDVFR